MIHILLATALLQDAHGADRAADASHAGHGDARRADVAARGSSVMPFDLERTTHRFTPLPNGGTVEVVSDDRDARQVKLARDHLRAEAANFARGDFRSPEAIHGRDMPGVSELTAGAKRIDIAYADTAEGGRIRFITSDPALVRALHRWLAAQVRDHGRHAEGGHKH